MPRVLFVTYPWMPAFSAGVRHVATLARYLPEAGWDPIILDRDWSEGLTDADASLRIAPDAADDAPPLRSARAAPVVHVPFAPRDNALMRWHAALGGPLPDDRTRQLRRAARGLLDAAYPLYGDYPDAHRGWVEPAVRAGVAAIRQFGIGAVVSVSAPDSAHLAGGEMARAAGVPWIPLFGELGSFRVQRRAGESAWERMERRELGRRWLRGAAGAIAVSPAMKAHLEASYALSVETLVVPFDPEERRLPPRRAAATPLRLVHVGRLDPATQDVVPLLDALDELLADDPAVAGALRVEFVGSEHDAALEALLDGRAAARLCTIRPRVCPAEAITVQREADMLLLFEREDPLARYPSTLFEVVNARRPVVAVAHEEGFVARVLRETKSGEAARYPAAIAALVRRGLDELRSAGEVASVGDDTAIARHGGPEQARRLAALLDVASAGRFGTWQRV